MEKVTKLQWGDAAPRIQRALDGYGEVIAAQWKAGEIECLQIGGMTFAVRSENDLDGPQLVIVAAEGRGLKHAAPTLFQLARHNGFKSIRLHNSKPGIQRILQRYRPVEVERVYRIEVDGTPELGPL